MSGSVGAPLEAGQPVVLGAGPEHARRWFRTSVHRVDGRMIWLYGAPLEGPRVEVAPGESVTCHTWRYMDAAYQVHGMVAFARQEPQPLLGVSVRQSERIQQREFVRVPLATEARARYLGPDMRLAELYDLQEQPFRLEVRDVSAGGLRGRSDLPLSLGDELEIELVLPRLEKDSPPPAKVLSLDGTPVHLPVLPDGLTLQARVVRLIETANVASLACEIGVAFVGLSRESQERIIRFALDVQRDRRRRGLL
jgi:c-di-GMP-binding flagellar brake protein YcgR